MRFPGESPYKRGSLFSLHIHACLFIALSWSAALITDTAWAAPVVGVSVEGVGGPLLANVLAYLSIEQRKNDPDLSDELIRGLYEKSPGEIRSALQAFGYYKPDIRSELIKQDGRWLARYRIEPGVPIRIRNVNLVITGAGAGNPQLEKAAGSFPLKKGDVLRHGPYEKAKQDLQATAMDEGFLDAQFPLHRITVHLREYYATIDLHLDTGPLYRFGEVSFRQDILRPEFLGRFVPFQKGDPYRTSKLLELQDALTASDYFRQVEVKPRRDLARDLTIPVEVDLTPQKRQRYTFGLGYGTDTGFRGVLGWEDRWVNRKGHRFSTELRLSQIQRNFSARYIIPMKKPATDHLDFTAGLFHESTNIYTTETRMIGTSRSILRGSWQQTFYLNLQKEKFTIDDESGKSTLLLPGTGWTRIKADNRVFTTRGSRLVLDVRGADKMLLSSTSLIQFRSNLKFIRSPWDTGRIILRGDFGVTWVGDFPKLPASLRFFAGGDQSVRGYGHKTLGPMNAKGKVIGGRHLVVGSFEYDQRIYKKWGAAVFYDVGNALNKLSDPLKHGAGIGLRWRSPVGMVRLDFARALSERNRWHIHINIGPDL